MRRKTSNDAETGREHRFIFTSNMKCDLGESESGMDVDAKRTFFFFLGISKTTDLRFSHSFGMVGKKKKKKTHLSDCKWILLNDERNLRRIARLV